MTTLAVHRPDVMQAVRRWSAGRRAIAIAALPAYRLLAIAAILIVGLVQSLRFTVEPHDFAVMVCLLGGAVSLAAAVRWCRGSRPADALEAATLILASGMATGCLSVLLATLAPPFRDAELATADRWLFPFLSWPAMATALAAHRQIVEAMQAVYSTLLWQPFALVVLLARTGRNQTMWRFVHAWILGLIACLAIFTLVPAVTAQVHYGFARGSIAGLTVNAGWGPTALLLAIRSGAMRELASGSMAGMIDFPSFHALGATLLGWGFSRAGRIGWPMVALNILMIPTIPLIGSHYFVDLVAGIAIAVAIIAVTGRTRSLA